jgi:general stress protein 26
MDAVERNRDNEVPLEKKLDDLYKLIDGIDIAMLTTRRADGHLVSRPMSTQRRTTGTDLWFMTNVESEKFEDLARDPHVNLAYYKSNGEWASVSATAFTSRDRSKIHELYAAEWKLWFPDEGDARHGTPDDPRMVLIGVTVHAAAFLEVNKPRPVFLYEVVKGWFSGQEPELGTTHVLDEPHRPRA